MSNMNPILNRIISRLAVLAKTAGLRYNPTTQKLEKKKKEKSESPDSQGEKGIQGPKGEPDLKGDKGPQGIKGDQGSQGGKGDSCIANLLCFSTYYQNNKEEIKTNKILLNTFSYRSSQEIVLNNNVIKIPVSNDEKTTNVYEIQWGVSTDKNIGLKFGENIFSLYSASGSTILKLYHKSSSMELSLVNQSDTELSLTSAFMNCKQIR